MKFPHIELPKALEHMTDKQKMVAGLAFVVGAYLVYKWQQESTSNPLALGKGKLQTVFGTPNTSLGTKPTKPANVQVPLDLTAEQAASALGQQSLKQQIPSFFGGDPEGLHPTLGQAQAASKVSELAQQQTYQSLPFASGVWGMV